MGRIVFAGAMSHVLDPDYYERACGSVGRQKVEAAGMSHVLFVNWPLSWKLK